jgi:hypothetical protein
MGFIKLSPLFVSLDTFAQLRAACGTQLSDSTGQHDETGQDHQEGQKENTPIIADITIMVHHAFSSLKPL